MLQFHDGLCGQKCCHQRLEIFKEHKEVFQGGRQVELWFEVITEHHLKKPCSWEFPGHPVVRTQHFHCCGPKFDPWLGTKIPQSAQCSQKKKKRWSRVPEHRKQAMGTAWQIIKLEEEGQQGKEQGTGRAWQTHPGGQAPDAWGQKMPHSSPEASTAGTRPAPVYLLRKAGIPPRREQASNSGDLIQVD